jgi:AraC-like DNA-binding protein
VVTLDQGGAGRWGLRLRPAAGPAARLAELTWVQRPPASARAPWRIVPDVHPHLIAHRMADGHTSVVLVGPRSRFVDVSQAGRALTVGVRLLPGALPALLREPAWALRDRAVSVADAAGARTDRHLERIAGEDDPRAIERALLDLLTELGRDRGPDWRARGFASLALAPAVGTPSSGATRRGDSPRATRVDPSVCEAAALLGVSERALRDACRSELGLRPKEAQRIARLHRALTLGLSGHADADAAAGAGYADQAHFIRECKSLLGATPKAFRERAVAESFKTSSLGPP